MPTIKLSLDEIVYFAGPTEDGVRDKVLEDLREMSYLGIEVIDVSDGMVEIEVPEDKPYLVSTEGISLSIRYHRGVEKGIYDPDVNESDLRVRIADTVNVVRPFFSGGIVTGLNLDEKDPKRIKNLVTRLNEKLGEGGETASVEVHDLSMIRMGELVYSGVEPDEDTFVPVGPGEERVKGEKLEEMSPAEVIERHPEGKKKGWIVEDEPRYPAIYDSIGLFSLPPLVKGKRTEITDRTRDILFVATGTDESVVEEMATIVAYALDARGGDVKEIEVVYFDDEVSKPDLSTESVELLHEELEEAVGEEVEPREALDMIEGTGFGADFTEEGYDVQIPAYRTEISDKDEAINEIKTVYEGKQGVRSND